MPPRITSSTYETRKDILDSLSDTHRNKWKELRELQYNYNRATYGDIHEFILAICITVVGVMFLILKLFFYLHNPEKLPFEPYIILLIGGIFWFAYFYQKREYRKKLPSDADRQIDILKESPEIQDILIAFKASGEEWTSGDDRTNPSY